MFKTKSKSFVTSSLLLMCGLFTTFAAVADSQQTSIKQQGLSKMEFDAAKGENWNKVMYDSGLDSWQNQWFVDGKIGSVTNTADGMLVSAGPEEGNHAHHIVAWTKETFSGDIRLDFTYTRNDDAVKFVNIVYLYATGLGENGFTKDIFEWRKLREEPYMRHYFDNMNSYHISFAAYGLEEEENPKDYVRARRYLPANGNGLKGTNLEGDYSDTGLFAKDVPHQITVIKRGDNLWMEASNGVRSGLFHWDTSTHPDLSEGRVGIRHMFSRKATYRDFTVSTLQP
ncbi:DUF1961 family protein [Vibrio maritimus]|uniref:DUF1961 family protein n=1 Tax=Vibrio maritimus TaxID=990268 RepID=UPI003736AF1B